MEQQQQFSFCLVNNPNEHLKLFKQKRSYQAFRRWVLRHILDVSHYAITTFIILYQSNNLILETPNYLTLFEHNSIPI